MKKFNTPIKIVENYKIFKEIGAGSYGKVYYAENVTNNKKHAIKIIHKSKFFDK